MKKLILRKMFLTPETFSKKRFLDLLNFFKESIPLLKLSSRNTLLNLSHAVVSFTYLKTPNVYEIM